jgi:hypothetical protein
VRRYGWYVFPLIAALAIVLAIRLFAPRGIAG